MSLHISVRYYPPASQKTLPPMCQKGGPPATFWYVVPCLVTVITAGEMSLVHTFYMERDIFFSKNRGGDLVHRSFKGICAASRKGLTRASLWDRELGPS